jgi:hypothetical protein
MTQNGDDAGPGQVIVEYVEACRVGSVDRLRAVFHPDALMSGYYQREFYMGNPDPFFDEVRDNPSPSEIGSPYEGEITTVEEIGDCASVTLKEFGFLGSNFTDWFHLAKIDGQWLILSKTYVAK